jgi:hypothetical protein
MDLEQGPKLRDDRRVLNPDDVDPSDRRRFLEGGTFLDGRNLLL